MYHGRKAFLTGIAFLALFGGSPLIGGASSVEAESASSLQKAHKMAMTSPSAGWAEKLGGQTVLENSIEGRAERAARVELQPQRMMDQMTREMEQQSPNPALLMKCRRCINMVQEKGMGC